MLLSLPSTHSWTIRSGASCRISWHAASASSRDQTFCARGALLSEETSLLPGFMTAGNRISEKFTKSFLLCTPIARGTGNPCLSARC